VFKFETNIPGFNPVGIMMKLGVQPRNPMYYEIMSQIRLIITNEVLSTAVKLNQMVKDRLISDMNNIEEYRVFPRYITIMSLALANSSHVGVRWTNLNTAQAKFIDTDLLGDIKDLQENQKIVYPLGGT
jgi:hypothetical protein